MKPQQNSFPRYHSWLVAITLGLGLLWIYTNRVDEINPQQLPISQPYEGFPAPDFEFSDSTGSIMRLSDLRGQPVILNFWASWCPPCRAEMPAIQAVHQAYQAQGLVVLGVNTANQDSLSQAQDFITEMDLSFQMLYDSSGAIQSRYDVSALPTTFFIDRFGVIHEVIYGGPIAEALLAIHAEEILEEKP